jgi:hypothetical protein
MMSRSSGTSALQVGNVVAFVAVLVVNALAGSTKLLNGRNTADVSAAYPTFITPAGFTFSIWGIIYVLLFAFVVFLQLPLLCTRIQAIRYLDLEITKRSTGGPEAKKALQFVSTYPDRKESPVALKVAVSYGIKLHSDEPEERRRPADDAFYFFLWANK